VKQTGTTRQDGKPQVEGLFDDLDRCEETLTPCTPSGCARSRWARKPSPAAACCRTQPGRAVDPGGEPRVRLGPDESGDGLGGFLQPGLSSRTAVREGRCVAAGEVIFQEPPRPSAPRLALPLRSVGGVFGIRSCRRGSHGPEGSPPVGGRSSVSSFGWIRLGRHSLGVPVEGPYCPWQCPEQKYTVWPSSCVVAPGCAFSTCEP
jgi:hypothetical protein